MKSIELDISWEIEEDKKLEDSIRKVVKAALELENAICDVNLSVVITDNENIRQINYEQRNIDKATDVLSFPGYEKAEWEELKEIDEEILFIGDIVISKEKVEEQAKEYGHSFEREFCYLTAHGMLHLMGYDHMNDEDKAVMREKEEAVMSKLNLER